jgi:hypothetical protein
MPYEIIEYGSFYAVLRDDGKVVFSGSYEDCFNWIEGEISCDILTD